MTSVNWANPVFGSDVQTSAAYLQRLQEFLAQQQGSTNNNDNSNGSATGSPPTGESSAKNKRKSPSTNSEIDVDSAIKDRRQSIDGTSTYDAQIHTHTANDEGVDGKDSAGATSKSKSGKGSTSDKRKEQNRNAQRAFRERKEKVLRDLEDKIDVLNKTNTEQSLENQNLKELVSRLQEENARLQKSVSSGPPAPQSDFTFSMNSIGGQNQHSSSPSSSSTSPPTNPSSSSSTVQLAPTPPIDSTPNSLSDADIIAFLKTAPPPQQQPAQLIDNSLFNFIPVSMPQSLGDDWAWNSSAFGTEIPQAVPPSVTKLFDQYGGAQQQQSSNLFDSSAGAGGSPSLPTGANYQIGDAQDAFPSLFTNTSSSYASPPQFGNGINRSNSNSTGVAESPGHYSNGTGSGASPSDSMGSRHNNSNNSQAVQSLPGFYNVNNVMAGAPFASSNQQQQPPSMQHRSSSSASRQSLSSMSSGYNTTKSPNSIFDIMSYRDPSGTTSNSNSPNAGFNFASLLAGAGSSGSSEDASMSQPQQLKSEFLDFNDFLVASPPAFDASQNTNSTQSPVSSSQQNPSSLHRAESSSSSSLPTLNSTPATSNASSPQSFAAFMNATSRINLPEGIKYDDPLIMHVCKDWPMYKQYKAAQEAPRTKNIGEDDIGDLCYQMSMKAHCKEKAEYALAESLKTDEETMRLFNQFMNSQQQQHQQQYQQ